MFDTCTQLCVIRYPSYFGGAAIPARSKSRKLPSSAENCAATASRSLSPKDALNTPPAREKCAHSPGARTGQSRNTWGTVAARRLRFAGKTPEEGETRIRTPDTQPPKTVRHRAQSPSLQARRQSTRAIFMASTRTSFGALSLTNTDMLPLHLPVVVTR